MPSIRDWKFNYGTVTTDTSISCAMPSYAANDLLLAIVTHDTTAQQMCGLEAVGSFWQFTTTGAVWTDLTTAANNVTAGDIYIQGTTGAANDAAYWGHSSKFNSIAFQCSTAPSANQTWVIEYWNGAWVTLTTTSQTIINTMTTGVKIATFAIPGDWTVTVPGSTAPSMYYVRIRVSAYTNQTTKGLGTQAYVGVNWTQLFTSLNTSNLCVLYKISTASEADPLFGYSAAETANVHLLSIQDINTTTPFNGTGGGGTGYRATANSASRFAIPAITTTVNNSLLIFVNSESGTVVPGVLEGACIAEDAMDGSAHSDGFSWGFQATAGAGPTVYSNKAGTAAGVVAMLGISPPSGGATVIPTYCASDASIYIDPIHGVTAYNGNTAFAATSTTNFGTTVGARTLANGTVAALADVGVNSYHSMGQVTGGTTNGTYTGGALVLAVGNKPNVNGKNVIVHMRPVTPKTYQTLDPISKATSKGVIFGMASTAATACKNWHVHGSFTDWNTSTTLPLIVNSANTTGLLNTVGTFVDTSVLAFNFAISGTIVAPVVAFGSLWALDTTVIAGGNAADPVKVPGIVKAAAIGKERMSLLQQGASQALVLQPVQLGNGGTNPIYLDIGNSAFEFPQQYNVAARATYYCSVDNICGITFYPGAADTMYMQNTVFSSKSKFHWKWHASSAAATVDTDGCQIIGAGTVQFTNNINLNGATFNSCDEITAATNTLNSCVFIKSTGTNGAISITGASQAALQTALDKFVSCSFTSNTTPLGALRIIYTGAAGPVSLNMSTGSFSGNTKDIRWEAPAASALTINKSGSANPSTYSATNSNTVTFSASYSVTLTGLKTGSDIVVLAAGTSTERLNIDANAGTTYAYNYSDSGTSVDIGVFKAGYIPFYVRSFTLPASSSSLPIAQATDRNYA